jgi:hypothetical protein
LTPVMSWEERAAKNEDLFREINEGIEDAVDRSSTVRSSRVIFVCECADPACREGIELWPEEYRKVRLHGKRFLVAPGHVDAEIERTVAREDHQWVVEKLGPAGDAAEKLDDSSSEASAAA